MIAPRGPAGRPELDPQSAVGPSFFTSTAARRTRPAPIRLRTRANPLLGPSFLVPFGRPRRNHHRRRASARGTFVARQSSAHPRDLVGRADARTPSRRAHRAAAREDPPRRGPSPVRSPPFTSLVPS